MIPDDQTNLIYFSGLLRTDTRFKKTYQNIKKALDLHSIDYNFLPNTKDIWARDYMPVQISHKEFVEYKYDPDYLQSVEDRPFKTYPDIVCNGLKLITQKTDIILDGGNLIKANNRLILTDKAIQENINCFTKEALSEKIKTDFNIDHVTWIPWDKSDKYGHADGMIRFIDDNTVLLNHYFDSYNIKFKRHLFGALNASNLKYQKLSFNVKNPDIKRNWAYINYLQTENIILLPKFSIKEDDQALDQFKSIFPSYAKKNAIHQINTNDIIKYGGALNCISWTIQAKF